MIGYQTEERDWSRGLDEAGSVDVLRKTVAAWMPHVPDALAAAEKMTNDDFPLWRHGLASERRGRFAGEEWAEKFGAILMPTRLMRATLLAEQYKVPLGVVLNRIEQQESPR